MKKLFLIAAISTTLFTSTISFAEENEFYVKAEAGASFLNKIKNKLFDTKMTSKAVGIFGLGAGYYVMENVRTDLTLHFLANPQFKKSTGKSGVNNSVKHKGKVMSLLLNGYVDLFDGGVAKLFSGAGIGWSQVKEKIQGHIGGVDRSYSTKKANNFAYQLTVGASGDVAEGVAAELSYRWSNYGKTKKVKEENSLGNTGYKGHNVVLGIKFDI